MNNILLLYNLKAGRGRFSRKIKRVAAYLKEHDFVYDVLQIKENENASDIVEKGAASYQTLIIAGGDGTLHSVISGLMKIEKDKRPAILLLPFGTANDYAKMLGLKKRFKETLPLLSSPNTRLVDIHQINDEYFAYAAAWGKFSNVSYNYFKEKTKPLGKITYLFKAFIDIFNSYACNVKIAANKKVINKKALLIIIRKGDRLGGFKMSRIPSFTHLNDGQISVTIFTRNNFLSWNKVIFFLLFKGYTFKSDITLTSSEVNVALASSKRWNIDGERGPEGDVNIKVLPGEIRFYVNSRNSKKYFN